MNILMVADAWEKLRAFLVVYVSTFGRDTKIPMWGKMSMSQVSVSCDLVKVNSVYRMVGNLL